MALQLRSVLAMLGIIIIGVAAVILLVAIGNGGRPPSMRKSSRWLI